MFSFFFLVAVSGLLLGWKKHSGGIILAKTIKGTSSELKNWLPLDKLHTNACNYLHERVDPSLSLELDRIDVRQDKGVAKFVFVDGYWGLQLDGVTGELLNIERRRSDFIENLHDGSLIDRFLGTDGYFKLFYTSVTGIALLIFTITGFWLWIGPKRMKAEIDSKI